jgi:protein-disulfide isomerase
METRSRNLFLAALALIAIIGVIVVVLLTRPASDDTAGDASNNAPERVVTWTGAQGEQKITGKAIKGDPTNGARFALGDEKAPVTIVEWANYQCHYCEQFAAQTKGQLISEYVDTGKVRFLYRDFPFSGQGNVVRASSAAACANDQGRYWDYHDVLYRAREDWGSLSGAALDAKLVDYASQIGLDGGALGSCINSGKHVQDVNNDASAAVNFGLSGTPAFIIDGYAYEGAMPIEAFRKVLADAGVK